jgi:hypothetical protein
LVKIHGFDARGETEPPVACPTCGARDPEHDRIACAYDLKIEQAQRLRHREYQHHEQA